MAKRNCSGTATSGRLYGVPRQAVSAQATAIIDSRRMAQCAPASAASAAPAGGAVAEGESADTAGGKNRSLIWLIST